MTLSELVEALENARGSEELYLSDRELDDQLVASVDGLCLPIEEVTVSEGQVIIHIDMHNGYQKKNKEKK
jgi:hypothetical protein